MNLIWVLLLLVGCGYGLFMGRADAVSDALLSGAGDAVTLCLAMAGGFAYFGGLMAVLRAAGAAAALGRVLAPALRRLFPKTASAEAREAILLCVTANMLGLGNAATPLGVRAMSLMDAENGGAARVSGDMCMLLIVSASSVQLLPTTVIALRAAAGSAAPASIVLPTLFATAVSTAVGVGAGLLCARRSGGRA